MALASLGNSSISERTFRLHPHPQGPRRSPLARRSYRRRPPAARKYDRDEAYPQSEAPSGVGQADRQPADELQEAQDLIGETVSSSS